MIFKVYHFRWGTPTSLASPRWGWETTGSITAGLATSWTRGYQLPWSSQVLPNVFKSMSVVFLVKHTYLQSKIYGPDIGQILSLMLRSRHNIIATIQEPPLSQWSRERLQETRLTASMWSGAWSQTTACYNMRSTLITSWLFAYSTDQVVYWPSSSISEAAPLATAHTRRIPAAMATRWEWEDN